MRALHDANLPVAPAPAALADLLDAHVGEGSDVVPRGPRGLWASLVGAGTGPADRPLPTVAVAEVTAAPSMFDYDPDLALAID
ncbi:MAG: hypothetical protein ACOYOP_00855 [Microthrixaceae bacterium]